MYFYSFGILTSNPVTTTEIWTDGVVTFRLQVRGIYLYLDQTITATGFSGTQGVDWDAIHASKLP